MAVGATVAITFSLEFLVMLALSAFPPLSPMLGAIVDAFLLSVLALPLIFFLVVKPVGSYAVQREEAERALKDSERLLRETQVIAGLGSYVLDLSTGRWRSSGVLDDLFGIDDAYDRSVDGWVSLVHPEWREAARRHLWDHVLAGGGRFDLEYQIVRHRDGQARWVHGLGEVERDRAGHALRLIGTISDITERRQRETARRRTEASLRLQSAALNAAANMIVITDRDGTVEWVNRAFTETLGYSVAEAVGRNPRDLVRSGTHDRAFYKGMWDTLLAGRVWSGELVNRRKDGSLYTEEQTITPILDAEGTITHFVAVKQDVSERKQLEQQFLRAQRLESIGVLAGGIAHDLNNVLAPILLSIEILRDNAADDDTRQLLDTIAGSTQRGADLVTQVLAFASGRSGRRLDVQPRHLIREMEKIARETFPKNIRVQSHVGPDLWSVLGDPTQLHQVLLNLCINARDAMPDGGDLSITAENLVVDERFAAANPDAAPGPYVMIRVEDTGSGMPPEIMEHIFDPFFTTKEVGRGTGLGLSTSMNIVKHHGGFLRVSSEPGVGTQFRVWIPAPASGRDEAEEDARLGVPKGQGQTVLFVDDEVAIRHIAREVLEGAGYRVRLAADGAEAVSVYAEHADEIAVVVTDIIMPVMDGVHAVQVLRTMNPAVRIIAISGRPSSAEAVPRLEIGTIPFLLKPFTSADMLRAIDTLVSGAPRKA